MNQMSFGHSLAHFIDQLISDETVDFRYRLQICSEPIVGEERCFLFQKFKTLSHKLAN